MKTEKIRLCLFIPIPLRVWSRSWATISDKSISLTLLANTSSPCWPMVTVQQSISTNNPLDSTLSPSATKKDENALKKLSKYKDYSANQVLNSPTLALLTMIFSGTGTVRLTASFPFDPVDFKVYVWGLPIVKSVLSYRFLPP